MLRKSSPRERDACHIRVSKLSVCSPEPLEVGLWRDLPDPLSSSCEHQIPQTNQVVGGRCEGEHPTYPLPPAMLRLAQSGHGLDPTEDLLDAFTLALAHSVTWMPRRARVNRTRAILVFILGHVRRHANRT